MSETLTLKVTFLGVKTLDQFVVWIDCNCGRGEPDWEQNSPPQPLKTALEEAARCRNGTDSPGGSRLPAIILPDGETPRKDGRLPTKSGY